MTSRLTAECLQIRIPFRPPLLSTPTKIPGRIREMVMEILLTYIPSVGVVTMASQVIQGSTTNRCKAKSAPRTPHTFHMLDSRPPALFPASLVLQLQTFMPHFAKRIHHLRTYGHLFSAAGRRGCGSRVYPSPHRMVTAPTSIPHRLIEPSPKSAQALRPTVVAAGARRISSRWR